MLPRPGQNEGYTIIVPKGKYTEAKQEEATEVKVHIARSGLPPKFNPPSYAIYCVETVADVKANEIPDHAIILVGKEEKKEEGRKGERQVYVVQAGKITQKNINLSEDEQKILEPVQSLL